MVDLRPILFARQVWLAFCKWIVERFDKGKGVNIINFIRLSWEQDEVEKEMYGNAADKVLRPVWRMSESFERAYNQQASSPILRYMHKTCNISVNIHTHTLLLFSYW